LQNLLSTFLYHTKDRYI